MATDATTLDITKLPNAEELAGKLGATSDIIGFVEREAAFETDILRKWSLLKVAGRMRELDQRAERAEAAIAAFLTKWDHLDSFETRPLIAALRAVLKETP
jgi:hypothetical protein